MALIWGNGGLNIRSYDRDPEKAQPILLGDYGTSPPLLKF